jgi:hypothetical protein
MIHRFRFDEHCFTSGNRTVKHAHGRTKLHHCKNPPQMLTLLSRSELSMEHAAAEANTTPLNAAFGLSDPKRKGRAACPGQHCKVSMSRWGWTIAECCGPQRPGGSGRKKRDRKIRASKVSFPPVGLIQEMNETVGYSWSVDSIQALRLGVSSRKQRLSRP